MKTNQSITRREFIRRSACGAGLAAVGGGLLAASGEEARKQANPLTYDLERFSKTDPKLVQYEEASRFTCPGPDPRRLALGAGDRCYVAGRNGISVLNRLGEPQGEIPMSAPARCVAAAGDGTVFAGARDHIEVFSPKGARQAAWESPGGRTWLTGLTVDEGEIYAAAAGNRVVLRYARAGKLLGRIGEKDRERSIPGLIVPSPYLDVKLGQDGLLRMNNPGRHRVEVYTVKGDLEFSWGRPSAAIDGFCGCCNPVSLALLPDGRCVTCEKGLPRAKVYSVQG